MAMVKDFIVTNELCVYFVDEVGKLSSLKTVRGKCESNSQSWLELEEVTVVINKCLGFNCSE